MKKTFILICFSLLFFYFASSQNKIDINTASLQELQKIIGIGSVLAQRIIEARPFYSLDELIKVERIGPVTLQKIKEQGLAFVDPETKPSPKTSPPAPGFKSIESKTKLESETQNQFSQSPEKNQPIQNKEPPKDNIKEKALAMSLAKKNLTLQTIIIAIFLALISGTMFLILNKNQE